MRTANYHGYEQDQEDFAQEVALENLKGRTTTMKNHLIDYLRREYGDTRYAPGKIKADALLNPAEVTELNSGYEEQTNTIDFESLINCLDAREQAYMNLIHRWGFTMFEVGQTFGVSEGRVSQEVKEINKKLKKAIGHSNLIRGHA